MIDRDHDASADVLPECSESDCGDDAAFFVYAAESEGWRPICDPHARQIHPSLEIHAWLESGYMKPVERGAPGGPPPDPRDGREEAFRNLVADAMGWAGSD